MQHTKLTIGTYKFTLLTLAQGKQCIIIYYLFIYNSYGQSTIYNIVMITVITYNT